MKANFVRGDSYKALNIGEFYGKNAPSIYIWDKKEFVIFPNKDEGKIIWGHGGTDGKRGAYFSHIEWNDDVEASEEWKERAEDFVYNNLEELRKNAEYI